MLAKDSAMAKYILVVPSAALPGRDDEYNDWYDDEHIRDVCDVPGIVAGKRYDALPDSPVSPPASYLAIYEIEDDDPKAVIAEIQRRAGTGEMTISPALDKSSAPMWLYKAR
jgi:hypothetical protein